LPTGHGIDVTARMQFTTTPLHFGGCRVWMVCPCCNGRVRVIFAGYGKIGCRRCRRVRYRSHCGDAKDRAHLAIAKIERRLITWRGRFYKPNGMLWSAFHRLCDRYDYHNAVLDAGLASCSTPNAPIRLIKKSNHTTLARYALSFCTTLAVAPYGESVPRNEPLSRQPAVTTLSALKQGQGRLTECEVPWLENGRSARLSRQDFVQMRAPSTQRSFA
jgi:hypothetical protein